MHRISSAVIEQTRERTARGVPRRLRSLVGPEWAEVCPPVEMERVDGGEPAAQAMSGLMAMHGRDAGSPRRLGLDVATAAATLIASQGAIAAALSRMRGSPVRYVRTSVLAGALSFLHHHLAIATCGNELPFKHPAEGEGPPFRTRDGQRLEIEALQGLDWVGFWSALGVSPDLAGDAWLPFVFRFLTARCALPRALHDAVASRDATEICELATTSGLAVCRVRSYPELLAGGRLPADRATIASAPAGRIGVMAPLRTLDSAAPLSGLRVVEVTSRLQGPLATLLLRQLGADVVKVEPPGGDFGRRGYPRAGNVGAAYLAYNRAKDRIEVDYKEASGRAQLIELAAGADVFIHSFPPGRADALGLDAQALSRANPGLVYAHASGWGDAADAPCAIGSDYLVQAHAALGDGLCPVNEAAQPSRLTLVDAVGGLLACEGVLAGLYRRARSGRGQHVHTTLYSGAMALQREVVSAIRRGDERGRHEGRPCWDLLDQPLAAADGYLMLGPLSAGMRRVLAEVCGLRRHATADEIAARIRTRPPADWLGDLAERRIPAAPVCTNLRTLPTTTEVTPWLERAEDACWVPGPPWRFSS